jgi:D-lyxose ketol-isomerase
MISKKTYRQAQNVASDFFKKAGLVMSDAETKNIEVADFGLNDLWNTGLQIVTYVNTERVCAKEMVLAPGQACPEHRHPVIGDLLGKEETFRCRYGTVYLYVEGVPIKNPSVDPPKGVYNVFNEKKLTPGLQYTIYPDTKHWFKAGSQGAVISEFSTTSHDESDIFTDPRIKRLPAVE